MSNSDVTPLEVAGYAALREQILGAAGSVTSISEKTFDALESYLSRALRNAKARNAPDTEVDAVEAELNLTRAARKFRGRVADLAEKGVARERIRGARR